MIVVDPDHLEHLLLAHLDELRLHVGEFGLRVRDRRTQFIPGRAKCLELGLERRPLGKAEAIYQRSQLGKLALQRLLRPEHATASPTRWVWNASRRRRGGALSI